MAWTLVGIGAAVDGLNTNNMSDTPVPAGIQSGDLLVLVATSRGNARTPSAPSGWSTAFRTDTASGCIAVFYKLSDGTEVGAKVGYPGTADSTNTQITQMAAFRGVDQTNPLGTASTASSWASADDLGPITGLTPADAGHLLLVVGTKQNDLGGTVALLTDANATFNEGWQTSSIKGLDASSVMQYAFLTGTPTIGSKTFDDSGTSAGAGVGGMVTFRPAEVAGTQQDLSGSVTGTGQVSGLNQYTRSEPTVAQLSVNSNVTDTVFTGGPLVNVPAIHVEGGTTTQGRVYPDVVGGALIIGVAYRISFYVKMDDGSVPNVANSATAPTDFSLRMSGLGAFDSITVEQVEGTTYRVSGVKTNLQSLNNTGLTQLTTHSGKAFTVTGFQVEVDKGSTSVLSRTFGSSAPVVNATLAFGGSASGQGTVVAPLRVAKALSGTALTGTATAAGTLALRVPVPLAGSITSVGTVAGALKRTRGFSGSVLGSATTTGALAFGSQVTLTGSVTGAAQVTGDIRRTLGLAGAVDGRVTLGFAALSGGVAMSSGGGSAGLLGDLMCGGDDTQTLYGYVGSGLVARATLTGSAVLTSLVSAAVTYSARATVKGEAVVVFSPAGSFPLGASLFVVVDPSRTGADRAGYAQTGLVQGSVSPYTAVKVIGGAATGEGLLAAPVLDVV